MPIPIPALKSIAYHEKLLYSGLALKPPKRILPSFEKPSTSKNTNDAFTVITNTQLNLVFKMELAEANVSAARLGRRRVNPVNDNTKKADTIDTNKFISNPHFMKFLSNNFSVLLLFFIYPYPFSKF